MPPTNSGIWAEISYFFRNTNDVTNMVIIKPKHKSASNKVACFFFINHDL